MTIANLIAADFASFDCFHYYVWMRVLQAMFFNRCVCDSDIQLVWKACKSRLRKH